MQVKKNSGNRTNHKKTKGSFKNGIDPRRNLAGQTKPETVALGLLLKQYLTDEGGKPCGAVGHSGQTNAQALAAEIWQQAIIGGEFQFVNFIADRIMGKVKDEQPTEADRQDEINEQLKKIAHAMTLSPAQACAECRAQGGPLHKPDLEVDMNYYERCRSVMKMAEAEEAANAEKANAEK